jgi:hypothetical protein
MAAPLKLAQKVRDKLLIMKVRANSYIMIRCVLIISKRSQEQELQLEVVHLFFLKLSFVFR